MQDILVNFQAVVFDLDGTLVDSEPAWEKAKRAVAARRGCPITDEQIAASVGRSLDDLLQQVFAPASRAEGRAIEEEIFAIADDWLPSLRRPIPGAAQFLRDIHGRGKCIAVCSSSPERLIRDALEQLGVLDLVGVIVSADPLPRRKPDPLPYQLTAERLAVPPAELIAVEDTVPGARSAKGAGLFTIAIGPETSSPDFDFCDLRVVDFTALHAFLGI